MNGRLIKAYRVKHLIFELDRDKGIINIGYIAEEGEMDLKCKTKDNESINMLEYIKDDVGIKDLLESILTIDGKKSDEKIEEIEETFIDRHGNNIMLELIGMNEVQ